MFSARELLVLQNVKELYDMHLMFFCRQYFGTRYRTEPDRCCYHVMFVHFLLMPLLSGDRGQLSSCQAWDCFVCLVPY